MLNNLRARFHHAAEELKYYADMDLSQEPLLVRAFAMVTQPLVLPLIAARAFAMNGGVYEDAKVVEASTAQLAELAKEQLALFGNINDGLRSFNAEMAPLARQMDILYRMKK